MRVAIYHSFHRIDPIADTLFRLHSRLRLDLSRPESGRVGMREIELLAERYLAAERELVAAVDAAGGAVPLPDGRAPSSTPCSAAAAGGPGSRSARTRRCRRGAEGWPPSNITEREALAERKLALVKMSPRDDESGAPLGSRERPPLEGAS